MTFVPGAQTFTGSASMKVPPKRKGNATRRMVGCERDPASMKVPPKRKGNPAAGAYGIADPGRLNESPSEKEGKFREGLTGLYGNLPQ